MSMTLPRDEDGIVSVIARVLPRPPGSVRRGIGDDAAVVRTGGRTLLLTTDIVLEGVHFVRGGLPYRLIGRKALAVNISDIAAMAGRPVFALVSLGLTDADRASVGEIYRGMLPLCREFSVSIVGGNISRSPVLFVDVALVGVPARGKVVCRNGARPGDRIFVTGSLGGSRLRKHARFVPRVREAAELVGSVPVSAMMDISDGLASDLPRLARASGCGFRIDLDCLPVSAAARDSADPVRAALADGEDYELLFTVPARHAGKVPSRLAGVRVTAIGEMTGDGRFQALRKGKRSPLPRAGFDHFAS